MSYTFKPKYNPQDQFAATVAHRQDLIEKSDARNRPGQRTYNARNNRANMKGKGDVGGDNKHHEPRFNIHEIPRIIRVMRDTNGFYEEGAAWERYLHHYRNYEKLIITYKENMAKFKAGKMDHEPRRPTMPAEPNGVYYAEKRGPPKPYKRPGMYQGASRTGRPFQVVSSGSMSYSRAAQQEAEPPQAPQLVEVEKLRNVRSISVRIPTIEIPAELSDYLEVDSEPTSA
jgi:hypothetical protein